MIGKLEEERSLMIVVHEFGIDDSVVSRSWKAIQMTGSAVWKVGSNQPNSPYWSFRGQNSQPNGCFRDHCVKCYDSRRSTTVGENRNCRTMIERERERETGVEQNSRPKTQDYVRDKYPP
ncbi:hypothetical protein TNCV_1746851 [Trichonephila clavipes]|nr:hypothetical protein TNCV_1746851 [Trichonephila clavipes]